MQQQIDHYLGHLANEEGYSDNTIVAYRNDLGQLVEWLHSTDPQVTQWASLTPDHVSAYLLAMRERDYARSTMARKMAAIKSFFQYLVDQGSVRDNPTEEINTPKVKKGAPQALSRDGIKRLLNEAAQVGSAKGLRDHAMLELLYATGIRVSELVSLQVGDIDSERWTLRCGSTARELPISPRAMGALQSYLHEGRRALSRSDGEHALFLNMRGTPLTRQGLWLIIKQYVDSAGIKSDVTPHTLRHSFAVHRLKAGSDLSEVKELLGHANLSTTQIYNQATTDDE